MSSSKPSKPRRARALATALPVLVAFALGGCATPAQEANSLLVRAAPDIDGGHDLPGGIELARQATVADPADSKAWYWLGYGLFLQKHYDQAVPALRKALDAGATGDQYWSAVYTLGQCYLNTSNEAAFRNLLSSIGGAQAKTAPSLNSQGLLFLSANMLGPAILSFRGAIALDPGNPIFPQNLAEAVRKIDSSYGAAYRAHPSLDMLLSSKEAAVEVGRWRNRMLVDAKETLVPAVLRDSKSEDLQALATKVEQTILDLTHETEMASERAERAEGNVPGSGDGQREIALVYRERIALLKPILASVREEIGNRKR